MNVWNAKHSTALCQKQRPEYMFFGMAAELTEET
jgi:hypothetical protein